MTNPMSSYCEDFPCCGHEQGDCDGTKYGTDKQIKERAIRDYREGKIDYDDR